MSLRSAARQVAIEDSIDTKHALFDAADDLALKHGLESPKKDKKHARHFDDENESQNFGPRSAPEFVNDARELAKQMGHVISSVDDDVQILSEDMGMNSLSERNIPERKPKLDKEFDDNLLGGRNKINNTQNRSSSNIYDVTSDRNQIRYLNTRKSIDNRKKSTNNNLRSSQGSPVQTEQSRVSRILERAPARASLNFKSANDEILFRGMQQVKSAHEVSRPKVRKSEADLASSFQRISSHKIEAQKEPSLFQLLLVASNPAAVVDKNKKYAMFDEADNCTFQPKRITKSSYSGGESLNDNKSGNFLLRQEKTGKKETKTGFSAEEMKKKEDFEARLDNKVCPQCGRVQSYEQFKENKRNCEVCKEKPRYTPKIAWSAVKNDFYRRQQKQLEDIDYHRRELSANISQRDAIGYRTRYIKEEDKLVVEKVDFSKSSIVWDEDVEQDFNERMIKSEFKKQLKLTKLENEIYGSVGSLKSAGRNSTEVEELDYYDNDIGKKGASKLYGVDAATAFMHRYEEDLKRRNEIKALQREQEMQAKSIILRGGSSAATNDSSVVDHSTPFKV